MDKYWFEKYDDKKYALKQLNELKHDLSCLTREIENKLGEFDKIECGLTTGHKWRLHKFYDTTYPLVNPPGVYWYKCEHCGEIIILKACEKKIWETSLKLGEPK